MKDVIEAMQQAVAGAHAREGHGIGRSTCEAIVRAALSAALERGYRLVPVEPSEEMFSAGDQADEEACSVATIYRAMIAASPEVK